jgi:hypothetical protein
MTFKATNKFQLVEDQLREYCKNCKYYDPSIGKCLKDKRGRVEVRVKYNQLYYSLLHPHSPCGDCIVRPACGWDRLCEEYKHYCNMRRVARCELTGQVIYFTKNKKYLLMDSPDEVDAQEIAQAQDFDGNKIDMGFTERYIQEIKTDSLFKEILETERELLEYRSESKLSYE